MKLAPRSYQRILQKVMQGKKVFPRGVETKELINFALELSNPLDRVVTAPERKINLGFGLSEFFSLIFNIYDIEFFKLFAPSYDKFSSDGLNLDGSYAERINRFGEGIEKVITLLESDPDSRQAVLSIFQGGDLFGEGGKNTPCTLSLQFLVRSGELHCIVNMRSNDVWLGLPYDMFSFSLLQEYLARRLNLKLGRYYHNAGSFHIYKKDEKKALSLIAENHYFPGVMKSMPKFDVDDIANLKSLVFALRDEGVEKRIEKGWSTVESGIYFTTLLATMLILIHKNDQEKCEFLYPLIQDPVLKFTVRPHLNFTSGVYHFN